jgi:hypothetical protein
MKYQIDFLPVGDSNGDAICVRYGEENAFFVHVVDGGFTDTADIVIEHIRSAYGPNVWINDLVLSHADNDHACGLVGILKAFEVRRLWMNRPWKFVPEVIHNFHGNWTPERLTKEIKDMHPYLVELEEIAARKRTAVLDVFQGAKIGQFIALAPSRERYIRLIPDLDKTPQSYAEKKGVVGAALGTAKMLFEGVKEEWGYESLDKDPPATSASNETSVVQLGVFDGHRVLLTGDVGPEGLMEAARYAAATSLYGPLTFVQVPHHGSRRNVTPVVLDTWLGKPLAKGAGTRGVAFCSVGKDANIYPRRKVNNAFLRRGFPVHATRGIAKLSNYGWPRDGWGHDSQPEPFSPDVEDDD